MEPIIVFDVLKNIKPGDTLCSDLTIVEHNMWSTSVKRFLYGDTRTTTVELIESAVNEYCEQKSKAKYLQTKEIELLEEVRAGIKNLKKTYKDDGDIKNRLNESRKQLRKLITGKPECSGSSNDESDNPFISEHISSEEFDIEEGLVSTPSQVSDSNSDIESPSQRNVIDSLQEESCEEELCKEEPESEITPQIPETLCLPPKIKPALKFDAYIKKKRGTSKSTPNAESRSRRSDTPKCREKRDSTSSTLSTIRRLPKLHVITMGDVVSEIDSLPESLSNPLSSLSENTKQRDIAWYVERFVRK